MINENRFPRFIPDKPTGKDVFDGQSQTHLAGRICEHIKTIDSLKGGIQIPRIIGVEGTWGSGKSNVVKKVDSKLNKENYYMFTYDAWGHQEDLQRRSILETLTKTLINDKVLDGKVSIPMRNGLNNEDSWEKQLSLLLSNKTITTRKSIPQLSCAAIWGAVIVILFTVCSSVAGQLIIESEDFSNYWWINTIPLGVAFCVILGYLIKDKSLRNISLLVDNNSKETVDEEYTSSEEPSVMEFKNWIGAISKHLATTKQKKNKVIIVFDNMDRLPSEKVMQLWSAIYTFFAGSEFENIWTIIPYDYIHLCDAIRGKAFEGGEKASHERDCIKRFINKTFPVVYTVPQPIITDYRKLFNAFFEEAFGEKNEHDQEHICQVFIRLNTNPNPRTVISFLNELVSLRLQWFDDKYRLQNLALYILKKDDLLYNGKSLDQNLLGDDIFNIISPFYPNKDEIRTQLCQFAYGLEDDILAAELPLRRVLQQTIKEGGSIVEHTKHPNFVRILEDVLSKEVDQLSLDNAVKSLVSLDSYRLLDGESEQIKKKWDMLTNMKAEAHNSELKFDDTLAIMISHASEKCILRMTSAFCKAMQESKIEDGAGYFKALSDMKKCLEKADKSSDINIYLELLSTTPQCFTEYVVVAGKDYGYYKLIADNLELNNYLIGLIQEGKDESATVMSYIYNDKSYDFSSLRDYLATNIKTGKFVKNVRNAAYINRILDDNNEIIKNRFSASIVAETMQTCNGASFAEIMKLGNEDIYAMYLADGNDVANFEKKMIPRLAECFEMYLGYPDLIKKIGTSSSAFGLLNAYIIINEMVRKVDIKYVAQNILEIKNKLELEYNTIFSSFNKLQYEAWDDSDIDSYSVYFKKEIFEEYKKVPGCFTDSIILLGVKAMDKQTKGFLVNTSDHQLGEYWRSFIILYLGTSYMPRMTVNLTKELTLLLDRVCTTNVSEYEDLIRKLIEYNPDTATLKEYLHDKLNNYFKVTNVSPVVFKVFGNLLPMLGHSMDDNTARGLISCLIKPIYRNLECAEIIVNNFDFYLKILCHDTSLAQDIIKGMKIESCYARVSDKLSMLVIEEET